MSTDGGSRPVVPHQPASRERDQRGRNPTALGTKRARVTVGTGAFFGAKPGPPGHRTQGTERKLAELSVRAVRWPLSNAGSVIPSRFLVTANVAVQVVGGILGAL
jgi:hypothetical protein